MSHVLSSIGNASRSLLTLILVAGALIGFSNVSFADDGDTAEESLTIGSKAPSLDVSHWLSNRGGEFDAVTEFESGNVYVVEFWATWCGPCIASMPHLAEMQDEYASKDVQFISVSDEDLTTVVKFLLKNVRGNKEQLYGELTSGYCLTTDPDRSVHKSYMESAGQRGIPTAFIVGKTGLIEWIGHPMRMDQPLAEIVGDEWDREEFAVNFKRKQALELAYGKISRELRTLMREDGPEAALDRVTEFLQGLDAEEDKELIARCKAIRFSLLMDVGGEEAVAAFKEMVDEADNSGQLNSMAWDIVMQVQRGKEIDPGILKAACEAAKRGVELAKEEGNDNETAMVMDTHANLLFLCDKLDEAIAVQKEAVELSDDKQIQKFLDKLLKAKEKEDV